MSSHADSATAGDLLDTMLLRLQMQDRGITNPSPAVRRATRRLVEELSKLDPAETIILSRSPEVVARYIRAADGSVLAEILQQEG